MANGYHLLIDWTNQTAVDKDKLGSYLFELDSSDDFKLEIYNYEVEIDPHGVRKRVEFLNYLKNQTPKFVFSDHKREEIRENGGWPYDKARRKVGDISNKSDGFYSELLLYLLMEGFFDFPLVSHKMAVKEDYNVQVKGTDGLYIGEFEDNEVVGYGEAKFYQQKSKALTDAINGISQFHGIDGINEREAEIDVARENISEDLKKSELNDLVERVLNLDRSIPIIHPILIAYEKDHYSDLKGRCESREDALGLIEEFHEREEFLSLVKDRIQGTDGLEETHLLVFFLRVENTKEFKSDLEDLI